MITILAENFGRDEDCVFGCRDDGNVIFGAYRKAGGVDGLAEFDSGLDHAESGRL